MLLHARTLIHSDNIENEENLFMLYVYADVIVDLAHHHHYHQHPITLRCLMEIVFFSVSSVLSVCVHLFCLVTNALLVLHNEWNVIEI